MGKDWLCRSGGGGGGGGRSTKSGRSGGVDEIEAPSGCMCSVFQLFDFHQFQSAALHQQVPSFKPNSPFLSEKPSILQGVEAPRNSLEEEEEPFMKAPASFPPTIKEEETLNIPMGIQIKTRGGAPKARTDISDLSSSEYSSSPGAAKTPSLVARLMGLDLLPPDSSSPSSSSNHLQLQYLKQELKSRQFIQARNYLDTDIIGTRSLPESPRISSARRSDVVDHRLSLQINKENMGLSQDQLEFPISKAARRREIGQENEIKSPKHYTRQIVKQVKESVIGRKVGLDITNTVIRSRERRDDQIVLLKSKKPSTGLSRVGDETKKNKPVKLSQSPLSSSSVEIRSQFSSNPNKECKQIASERYTSRIKRPSQTSDVIKNKQEEPFVRSSSSTNRPNVSDKKCKKTPLSSGLLNINVPTLFPVKKDPPLTTANSPQKQSKVSDVLNSLKKSTQLSSSSSQTYNKQEEVTQKLSLRENNSTTTAGGGGAEFQYIAGILKRTGIDTTTTTTRLSLTKWHSPFHPLNPSIFHHLEHSFSSTAAANNSQLRHRWNRKLIFQLVDEILAEILKPYVDLKPWVSPIPLHGDRIYGSELIERLWSRILSFPSADCQVLEDIDGLIGRDLRRSYLQGLMALEEEGESIVAEIEGDILDTLVHEMAVALFWRVG